MRPRELVLDLSKEPGATATVRIRQGEIGATVIKAVVNDNGEPVDLSDYDVYFTCRHPTGEIHEDNVRLSVLGNVATYTVDERVGAVPGLIKAAYFALKARALSYEWERSTDGGETWASAPEPGSRSPRLHYRYIPAFAGWMWRCKVTAINGTTATSNAVGFDESGVPGQIGDPPGTDAAATATAPPPDGARGDFVCGTSMDGSDELEVYATTQAFEIEVLPCAEQEGAGVAEAYSSQIEAMLLKCAQEFIEAEKDRDQLVDEALQRTDAAIDRTDAAAARALAAEKLVKDALSGNLDPLFKDYLDALKDSEGGFVKWDSYQSEKLVPDGETVQADESHVLSVRDGGLCYAKLSDVPFPFLPNVWELEDLTIRCGEFENAGAGWNTYEFPEPFEAPPTVICQAEGYGVDVKGVGADRFLYRLADNSVTSYGTETLYRNSSPSAGYPYVMALSVSGNGYTSPFTVLTSAESTSGGVSEAAKVRWIAIEDGR